MWCYGDGTFLNSSCGRTSFFAIRSSFNMEKWQNVVLPSGTPPVGLEIQRVLPLLSSQMIAAHSSDGEKLDEVVTALKTLEMLAATSVQRDGRTQQILAGLASSAPPFFPHLPHPLNNCPSELSPFIILHSRQRLHPPQFSLRRSRLSPCPAPSPPYIDCGPNTPLVSGPIRL